MKKTKTKLKLLLPALRAHMGDWIYYISFMRMSDIADRIGIAEQIHTNESLNDLLQRRLTSRSKEIVNYLENQEQRFFNSLIVGVYGGTPKWLELTVSKNPKFDPTGMPDYIDRSIGLLSLSGKETLFAIDGQHRVAAIYKAAKKGSKLNDEEVSVIFVSAKTDKENIERTRRLFSTLNRYAKPVKTSDIISLDEDDLVAIITRRLMDEHPLFINNSLNTKSQSLSGDFTSLNSIVAIYQSLDIYLKKMTPKKWKDFKALRPDDGLLNVYFQSAIGFWDSLVKEFKELKMLARKNKKISIKDLRHAKGGHIIFRPVGLLAISRAIRLAVDHGYDPEETINLIAKLPLELSSHPWRGLLWDSINSKMITIKENQQIAAYLIYYMVGCNLDKVKSINTVDKLTKLYAGAINWPEGKKLTLPKKVRRRKKSTKK